MANRTKLTSELIEKFLKDLADNGGIVSDAAKKLNISRTALYAKRDKDKSFKGQWDRAVDIGIDVLEDEAKRRAIKKSDYLMALLLKGYRSKFKERHEITGADGKPLLQPVQIYLPDNQRQSPKTIKKKTKKNIKGGRQTSSEKGGR